MDKDCAYLAIKREFCLYALAGGEEGLGEDKCQESCDVCIVPTASPTDASPTSQSPTPTTSPTDASPTTQSPTTDAPVVVTATPTTSTSVTLPPATTPTYDCKADKSYQTRPIDLFELAKVGVIDQINPNAPPVVKIYNLDELIGESFVELDKDQLDDKNVVVEFYAGVDRDSPTDDCSEGTLIESSEVKYSFNLKLYGPNEYNNNFPSSGVDECFPRTTTGRVVGVNFEFENPFYTSPADQTIWTSSSDGTGNEGTVDLCIRVSYKEPDDESKTISFVDTKVFLDVNLDAGFDFQQSVQIYSDQVQDFQTEVEAGIDVLAFLCGEPDNGNSGKPYDNKYGAGQEYRICVEIEDDESDSIELTGFGKVTCSNDNQKRVIINRQGRPDPITRIFTGSEVAGSRSFKGKRVATDKAIAFSTTVTSGYFSENPTSKDFLKCNGDIEVAVKKLEGADEISYDRQLRRIEWDETNFDPQHHRRQQQQESSSSILEVNTENVEAPFAASIQLTKSGATATTAVSRVLYYGVTVLVSTAIAIGGFTY